MHERATLAAAETRRRGHPERSQQGQSVTARAAANWIISAFLLREKRWRERGKAIDPAGCSGNEKGQIEERGHFDWARKGEIGFGEREKGRQATHIRLGFGAEQVTRTVHSN
jgi:hypothetical protein